MEVFTYALKWSEAILRWGHVLFAILWVGNSFLFNYLDNKLNKDISSKDIDGEGYLMHSGFFYKLSRLKTSPDRSYLNQLVIFKWQSYLTFVTGILLLIANFLSNSKLSLHPCPKYIIGFLLLFINSIVFRNLFSGFNSNIDFTMFDTFILHPSKFISLLDEQ